MHARYIAAANYLEVVQNDLKSADKSIINRLKLTIIVHTTTCIVLLYNNKVLHTDTIQVIFLS